MAVVYTTVLYEVVQPGVMQIQSQWIRRRADVQYRNMLSKLFEGPILNLCTDELEEGDLKMFFRANGINSANVFPIAKEMSGNSPKRIIYGMVTYADKDSDKCTEHDANAVLACASRLRQSVKRYKNLII